jgi:hypothetical protein
LPKHRVLGPIGGYFIAMRSGMEKFSGMARGRFYLAMTYLVWSLLPHFHILIHSHAGDSHFHASYTATQVETANQVLENLGSEDEAAAPADFGGKAKRLPIDKHGSSSGEFSAHAAGSELHGHFWEDPNLAGLVSESQPTLLCGFPVSQALFPYLAPALHDIGYADARGPPDSLPA